MYQDVVFAYVEEKKAPDQHESEAVSENEVYQRTIVDILEQFPSLYAVYQDVEPQQPISSLMWEE